MEQTRKPKQSTDKSKSKQSGSRIREAITKVDRRSDAVEEKIVALNNELRKFRDQMSKMREGSDKDAVKSKIIRVLKQKKIYEHQLENFRSQSFNMGQVIFAQDVAKEAKLTLQVIKDGARQLKSEYKHVRLSDIENVQDDLEEMMIDIDDINSTLGRNYYTCDIDEDELNAKLEALGEEIAVDDDSSYLDEVMGAPDASRDRIETEPEKMPSKSNDKVYYGS